MAWVKEYCVGADEPRVPEWSVENDSERDRFVHRQIAFMIPVRTKD
jgi:hypothetical protein